MHGLKVCLKEKVMPVAESCTGDDACSDACLDVASNVSPTLESCCDEMIDIVRPQAIAHCKEKVRSQPVLQRALKCPPKSVVTFADQVSEFLATPNQSLMVAFIIMLGLIGAVARTAMTSNKRIQGIT